MAKSTYIILIIALVILAAQGVILYWLGHSFICPCGYVKVWDNEVRGLQNSQHLFDWYSFLHVMYGMVLYFISWVLHKKFGLKFSTLFLLAFLASFGWEIFENTHYAINHYQISSVASNYYGDSILNSLSDTVCLALGFGLAYLLPFWAGITLFVGLTVLTTLILRDNIFISAFAFFFPSPFIINWQAAASIYH